MGTRSSRFTKFRRRSVDPRILADKVVEELAFLVRLHGTGSGTGHPSNRRERRAAMKALRLHVKTKVGLTVDYGRKTLPPKFPDRRTSEYTAHELFTRDSRKFG